MSEQGPPAITIITQQILQNSDAVHRLLGLFMTRKAEQAKHEFKKIALVAGLFFGCMTAIVAIAGALVYAGNLAGDAFAFLIAVIVGSMITFVGSAVFNQLK